MKFTKVLTSDINDLLINTHLQLKIEFLAIIRYLLKVNLTGRSGSLNYLNKYFCIRHLIFYCRYIIF